MTCNREPRGFLIYSHAAPTRSTRDTKLNLRETDPHGRGPFPDSAGHTPHSTPTDPYRGHLLPIPARQPRRRSNNTNQINDTEKQGQRDSNPQSGFWRPVVCQLTDAPSIPPPIGSGKSLNYSRIFVTTPEPTVRPPSRMAKRTPSSMAIGLCSSMLTRTLSPGIHISAPIKFAVPVTSVVRK